MWCWLPILWEVSFSLHINIHGQSLAVISSLDLRSLAQLYYASPTHNSNDDNSNYGQKSSVSISRFDLMHCWSKSEKPFWPDFSAVKFRDIKKSTGTESALRRFLWRSINCKQLQSAIIIQASLAGQLCCKILCFPRFSKFLIFSNISKISANIGPTYGANIAS